MAGIALGWLILFLNLRRFKWQPEKQEIESKRSLFSPSHVIGAFKTITKPRPDSKRLYIFLMLVMLGMILSPFEGLRSVQYFYVRTRYGWEVDQYSSYSSFNSAVGTIGKNTRKICFLVWERGGL